MTMDVRALKTNCIEKLLRRLFRSYSRLICRFPILPLLLSVLAAIGLGMGLIFVDCEYRFDALYLPPQSRASRDQRKMSELFPLDRDKFLPSRLYETDRVHSLSVALIAKDDGNLLAPAHLQKVMDINKRILSTKVTYQDGDLTYDSLCLSFESECYLNPVLRYLNDTIEISRRSKDFGYAINIPYPSVIDHSGLEAHVDYYLGEVVVVNDYVVSARYLLVKYYLRGGDEADLSRSWERTVQQQFSNDESPLIEVAFHPSDGLDEAQEILLSSAVSHFIGAFVVMTFLAMISCTMLRDHVASKPWLPLVAVATVAMAVISSIGLLSFCGLPFSQPSLLMPFLTLWTGLHHVFFMLSTWRCNTFSSDVNETLQETLEFTGTSITIATIIEVGIFFISATSALPAVQHFCLYTAVALVFNYIYQFTTLVPVMLLFGRIEAANRHSCTCLKVRHRESGENSRMYNLLCAGGSEEYSIKSVHVAKTFFETSFTITFAYIVPLLGFSILFIVYIIVSIIGSVGVTVGTEPSDMVPIGTLSETYLHLESQQMNGFGPFISVVVTEDVAYWDPEVQRTLTNLINRFERSHFVKSSNHTQCWFMEYYKYFNQTVPSNEDDFISTLLDPLLGLPNIAVFELDINFQEKASAISSSRCILVTENVGSPDQQAEMMEELRNIASIDTKIEVFAHEFLLYEQQVLLSPELIKINIITGVCVLVVASLLVPSPLVAIGLVLMVMSILAGVTGFTAFWGVSLDVTSIVNLLISVAIGVELTTHLAYAYTYVSISPISRLSWSFGIFGFPVVQTVLSSILGVVIFFAFAAYFYQTFAKIVFLTILFGLLHALLFFPTVLMIIFRGRSEANYAK